MAEKPEARVDINDFPGLISAADMDDLPPGGAVDQVNIGINKDSELTARGGFREVVFETG